MSNPTRDRYISAAINAGDLVACPRTGEVRYRGRVATGRDTNGYATVVIHNPDRGRLLVRAHRVVWLAHNPPILSNMTINHRNGIKDDNRLENLELTTIASNNRHAMKLPYEGIGYADDGNVVSPEWYREALRLAADPNTTTEQIQALKTLMPVDDSSPRVYAVRPFTRRIHT